MSYKKILITLLVTFLASAALYYFVLDNVIYMAIYAVVSVCVALFLSLVIYKKYEYKVTMYNECISFINKFIISYSISDSLIDSFESCKEILNEKLYLKLKDFDEVETKIDYLEKHYNFKIFEIFNGVLQEKIDKGGDVLSYCATLLSETRRSQSNVTLLFKDSSKHLFSFIVMWVFSFLIIGIARVSLSDFYMSFKSDQSYTLIITAGFVFFLISFFVFFSSLNLNKFMEAGKYEKQKKS